MFNFSLKFPERLFAYHDRIRRSFVTLEYQSAQRVQKDCLPWIICGWSGSVDGRHVAGKIFLWKMTMYPSYNRFGRDMILYFLKKHFNDKDKLITRCSLYWLKPMKRCPRAVLFWYLKEDYKVVNTEVRKLGYNIPPLVNAYMSLSPTMRMFGTAINDGFGDVEETGIWLPWMRFWRKACTSSESHLREHPRLCR